MNLAIVALWKINVLPRDAVMTFCIGSMLGLLGLFLHMLRTKGHDFRDGILPSVSLAGMILPANVADDELRE